MIISCNLSFDNLNLLKESAVHFDFVPLDPINKTIISIYSKLYFCIIIYCWLINIIVLIISYVFSQVLVHSLGQ